MFTYSDLRDIQKKELENGALVELGDDFYTQALDLLKEKKEESKDGSMLSAREYDNIKRVLSIIQAKREEKIVLMALRSEKSNIGLTREERDVFLKVQQIISEYRNKISVSKNKKNLKIQKIKMLKDVAQYKGANNDVYGPFLKGQEYVVPRMESEWLLKEKMAELAL